MRLKTKYKQILKFTKLFEMCTVSNVIKILNFKHSKWQKDFKLILLKDLHFSLKILKNYRAKEKSKNFKKLLKQNFFLFLRLKQTLKTNLLNKKKENDTSLKMLSLFKPLITKRSFSSSLYFNDKLNSLVSKKLTRYSIFKKEFSSLIRSLKFLYDNSINTLFFNRQLYKYKKQSFINFFVLPFYHLSVLLWKVGIFASTYLVDQYIYQNKILINFKTIKASCFLKTGDIISFQQNIFKEYKLSKHFSVNSRYILLNSILEVDLYTGSIIIIKGVELLHDYDLQILMYENINFNNFLNYIKY